MMNAKSKYQGNEKEIHDEGMERKLKQPKHIHVTLKFVTAKGMGKNW